MPRKRTRIRVGQRLRRWDGLRGYVDTNSHGTHAYEAGQPFQVIWIDLDGSKEAEYLTLEQCEAEGITWGRGVMPWAL